MSQIYVNIYCRSNFQFSRRIQYLRRMGTTISEQQNKQVFQLKQNQIKKLKPQLNHGKENFKPIFQYLNPIDMKQLTIGLQQTIQDRSQDRQLLILKQKKVGGSSISKTIVIPENVLKAKIQLLWNKFVNIKQKSYQQEYQQLAILGRGSYGVVLKVVSKTSKLLRAVKLVQLSKKVESQNRNFQAEVLIPMSLDHPNLMKLYQVFKWNEKLAIIMELCQGGDLLRVQKKVKFFPQTVVAQFFIQIMSAVTYMHKKNIIHRDLKLENILYDKNSQLLKISDFGTAVQIQPNKKLNKLVGTAYYIAPEVINSTYNQKCDIWSCGVILYTLISGKMPFIGKDISQIFKKVTNQSITLNGTIWKNKSKECKQLILKMLQKNPKKRISAQQVLNSQWLQKHNKKQFDPNNSYKSILTNLENFKFENHIQSVVYTYIASQLFSNKDKEELLEAFRRVDVDNDGVITREQLVDILEQQNAEAVEIAERILNIVDTNGSGRIDFTQFLVAASEHEQLIQIKRLQNAFDYLDMDKSGFISIQEVQKFFKTQEAYKELQQQFKNADTNSDGLISKEQFIHLLTSKRAKLSANF